MKKTTLELTKHITIREIKSRYKQSFLGLWWVVLNPFFQLIILSLVFSQVIRFENLGVPYPVFLFAGLVPWLFFENALTSATTALESNASIIKQVYFPREILVFSVLSAKTFDFVMSAGTFLLVMLFFKVPFTWYMLMFIPLFIIQMVFTYSIALLLAALNLLYRDVQFLFNLLIRLWFYLTPIIYPTDIFPDQYKWIFKLNPMSVLVNAYRQVLLGGSFPQWSSVGIAVLMTLVIYIVAYKVFKKLEFVFADFV